MDPVKDATAVTPVVVRQQSIANSRSEKGRPDAQSVSQQPATPPVEGQSQAPASAAERAESSAQAQERQREILRDALESINEQASSFSPALKFEPDADSGVVIIKVMNRSTGEVIRQLPPEAVVKASDEGTVPALVAETV